MWSGCEITQTHDAWTPYGDGLTADERRLWRSHLALAAVVKELLASSAYERAVARVTQAEDPSAAALREARAYGIGERRRLVADLMQRAAGAADPELAMLNARPRAVPVSEETRTQRKATYLVGDAFFEPLRHAACMLARKGEGTRLGPSDERAVRRMVELITAN